MKKKKIFFIMSTDDFSGAEAVNFSIIDGLKDKYDFYWVSKKGNINSFLEERNIKWIEINKLSVKEIKRIVKEYNPDILHATDFKASVICSLANTKVKLIEHLHNNSPWLKKISINSFAFLFAALKSNIVLTVSESIEKEYIFSNIIKKKIVCVGNPISCKPILNKVKKNDYKKEYDICCVARLTAPKNPFKFISIIEKVKMKIPNVKVVWVGKGDLEEQCIKLVNDKNLQDNIKFVGFKKNPYKFMASSKLFLLTSDWEGFGLVAFEALTLGLPCIVSNVGGLPSIVNDNCGFLSNDISEIVDNTTELLVNEDKLEFYSNNAILRSNEIDNFKNYICTIENIYEEKIYEKDK